MKIRDFDFLVTAEVNFFAGFVIKAALQDWLKQDYHD